MLEQDIAIAKLGTHVPSTSTSTQTTDHMHPDTAELAKIRVQWEAEKAAWNKQSVEWDIELRKERADHNTDLIAWTRKHKLLQEKLEETEAVAEQNRVWFDNERDIWNTERVRRPLEVAALKSECALLAQELEARTEKCKKLSDQLRDSVKANEDKTAWRKEQEEREAERFIWDVERSSWIQEREDHTTWNNRLAAWENERVAVDKERATWVEERTRLQTQVAALEEKNVQQDASHEKEGALWKADRVILEEKLDAVTTSLATLTTSTEALTQGKLSAEKDRDFFRDQYSQASAFVSSVRQENMALEEQANIAESRAKDGVAMVKGMFETQMQHLEDDLTRWKGLAELMQEKDRLTGDEVRRRAAEEPELRERCEWLVEKLMSREEELRRIGNSQRKLKAERSRLESKILKLQKQRSLYKSISEKPPRQGTNTVDIPATNGVSSEHDPSAVSDDEHGARMDQSSAPIRLIVSRIWKGTF
ncbi:hypothetical protein BJ138DRAFT_1147268 [Hygrophoropsis aurantiaca]|uniref:Uncharacterized protein n=1 Tax=Hygrophoropsis aurantiaca TaxID=72124 RepID=A0ACB8AIA3_9AGAM|nr:hypothetical protein BJ138DRAFT_1147268 [Hygrophoropsis aurantiaca]